MYKYTHLWVFFACVRKQWGDRRQSSPERASGEVPYRFSPGIMSGLSLLSSLFSLPSSLSLSLALSLSASLSLYLSHQRSPSLLHAITPSLSLSLSFSLTVHLIPLSL